ncbi:MAG: VWA domain-containing protein [Methanolobus sp.]|nr:VWA domain-containing protein [Methanolobus sp.]
MSEHEIVERLRRNLPRDFGIKVMYIGAPILGLRIPRYSVSEFSKTDTDILYDRLYSYMEQIRPDEIHEVYIVADSDHLSMDTDVFFRPLIGSSDTALSAVFKTEAHVHVDDAVLLPADHVEPDSSQVVDIIPDDAFSGVLETDQFETDPEGPVFADLLKTDMKDNEDHSGAVEDGAVEVVHGFGPGSSAGLVPKERASENSSAVCLHEPGLSVELTPKEYIPFLYSEGPEMDFEDLAADVNETTASERLSGELKEDKTVGKILNDFARNSQKKRLAAGRLKSGRRAEVLTKSKRGRYVRYRMPGEKITDIAIAPTVRAAAQHAKDGKIEIKKSDIREKVRRRRISSLINIVFDTSGSMDEQEKVQITTSVVIALLKDAYQRRDRVSLVTYSGRTGELVLPFTSSVEAAKRYLEKVPFGGTTPMASGMLVGLDTLTREVKKEPSAVPIMILVTDGTANSPLHLGGNIRREILQVCKTIAHQHINLLVVDISDTGSGLARELAMKAGGNYYHPRSLSKEALYSAIKQERDAKIAFV